MSSGAPFNPMRKTPPPPPYVDLVGVVPSNYVMVVSKDQQEYVIHRDVLRVSPLIRRAFAKRRPTETETVVIQFFDDQEEEMEEGSDALSGQVGEVDETVAAANAAEMYPDDGAEDGQPNHSNMRPLFTVPDETDESVHESRVEGGGTPDVSKKSSDGNERKKSNATAVSEKEEDPQEAYIRAMEEYIKSKEAKKPVEILKVALQIDDTVRLTFSQTEGSTLQHVLSYLHYKYKYEGKTTERPPLSTPLNVALEVMKIASALEC